VEFILFFKRVNRPICCSCNFLFRLLVYVINFIKIFTGIIEALYNRSLNFKAVYAICDDYRHYQKCTLK